MDGFSDIESSSSDVGSEVNEVETPDADFGDGDGVNDFDDTYESMNNGDETMEYSQETPETQEPVENNEDTETAVDEQLNDFDDIDGTAEPAETPDATPAGDNVETTPSDMTTDENVDDALSDFEDDDESGEADTESTTDETGEADTESTTDETGEADAESATDETGEADTESTTDEAAEADTESTTDETGEADTESTTDETGEADTESTTDEAAEADTEDTAAETDEADTEDTAAETDEADTEDTADEADESDNEDTADETSEAATEDTADETDEAATEDTADETDETDAEDTADETDTEDTADETDEAGNEDTADETDEAGTEDTADETDEADTEDTADETDEADTEDTADERDEAGTEDTADETDEAGTEDTADERDEAGTEDTADERDEAGTEDTADETDEADTEDTADETDEADTEDTADETDEADTEDTADTADEVDETGADDAEDVSDEANDSATDGQNGETEASSIDGSDDGNNDGTDSNGDAERDHTEKNAVFENVSYHQGQNDLGALGTCGPTSIANSLNRVTGSAEYTENKVLHNAMDNNLCHKSDNPYSCGGTTTRDVVNIIDNVKNPDDNIHTEVYEYDKALSVDDLANRLDDPGTVAMVGVDSATLWDQRGDVACSGLFQHTDSPSDHWITVDSPIRDEAGNLTGFNVIDSGGGVSEVSREKFEAMYIGDAGHTVSDPTAVIISNDGDAGSSYTAPEGLERTSNYKGSADVSDGNDPPSEHIKMSTADSEKLAGWSNRPDDNKYLQNKDVYDNPRFFDQKTGKEIWPGENGDPNTDGFKDGEYVEKNIEKGTKIDRYGSNYGTFFGETGTPIEKRAMSPNSDFGTYNQYEVRRPFPVREGEIAPWFNQPGGGIQYKIDPGFIDSIKNKLRSDEPIIDGLVRLGYLKRL